jgi:dienelactone hydrolase
MNMLSQPNKHNILTTLRIVMVNLVLLFSANVSGFEKDSIAISNAQQVKFKAGVNDEFLLEADYYSGEKKAGGVIVLHDCKSERSRYSAMANSFFQQGLHTLALDLRGYGGSVSPEFSQERIKQDATDIVSYQSGMALLTTYWQDDLIAAYHFLQKKVTSKQGIAIVSSGCSSAYAIALAENILLKAIVMITPQVTYADKERYKNLIDIPSYFITSYHHADSYEASQELFAWSGSKKSKMQIFKGSRYDYQLISREKSLTNDIAHWLNSNVGK